MQDLFDISHLLNSILDKNKLFDKILNLAVSQADASFGVLLTAKSNNRFILKASENARGFRLSEDDIDIPGFPESALFLSSGKKEKGWKGTLARLGVDVVVPVHTAQNRFGLICLGRRKDWKPYERVVLDYLDTMATTAAIALEKSCTLEEIKRLNRELDKKVKQQEILFKEAIEKKRIEKELLFASQIQERLLPDKLPQMKNFEISAHTKSCTEVGGDYLDFIEIGNGRLLTVVADISGKGMPAALLMSNLQAGLHILVEEQIRIDTAVVRLNNLIARNTEPEQFATFFIGILDDGTRNMEYINAGHNPPVLIRKNGRREELLTGGMSLGILENTKYETGRVKFRRGDLVLMYTDGVSESLDPAGAEFGVDRMLELVEEWRDERVLTIRENLEKAVSLHLGGNELQDDMTLAIARCI